MYVMFTTYDVFAFFLLSALIGAVVGINIYFHFAVKPKRKNQKDQNDLTLV